MGRLSAFIRNIAASPPGLEKNILSPQVKAYCLSITLVVEFSFILFVSRSSGTA